MGESAKKLTIDELLDRISQHPSPRYVYLICTVTLIWLSVPLIVYLPVFAGLSPTDIDWSCETEKCEVLMVEHGSDAICKEGTDGLLLGPEDITWHPERSSFAIDFDLYCKVGGRSARKTLISSIYFAGGFLGLLTGSFVFDNFGRKIGGLVGTAIGIFATFCGTFCGNYYFMLAIRLVQGYGNFIAVTGPFILAVELLPARHRNYINGYSMCLWAFGYPVAACVAYLIKEWQYIYLAACVIQLITSLPLILVVESPRYFLINNNTEAAKNSLKVLADMNGVELDFDELVLHEEPKADCRQQSVGQQFREFIAYPVLILETLIQMFLWLVVAMSYYGFNFGWSSIVPNMYLGYIFAAIGELIAYLGLVPLVMFAGRRRAMMLMYACASVSYLVAIPDVSLGNSWTLQSIACLVGLIFVSAAFSGVYLYTSELAPTSHRGMIFCMSSCSARIGSFLGPFIFNNLFDVAPKFVGLGMLALLMLMCCVGSFALVETGNREIASVPSEVRERRKEWKFAL